MKRPFFGNWLVCLALGGGIFLPLPLEAHPRHQEAPTRPDGTKVIKGERQADAALLGAIRSGAATEKEIETYTDRLFERDGERPSEATRGRLEAILEAALSVAEYRRSKVVWHQWGALLFDGGYYDSAIRAFGRALELDPGFLPSLLGSGTAYLAKGRIRRAVPSLLQSVQEAPQEPLGWFHLTQALTRLPRGKSPATSAEQKDRLTAFSLLRFEALFKGPLPEILRRWKKANPEAVSKALLLTPKEFRKRVGAIAPPIRQALAHTRKDGITFREAQRFEELRGEYLGAIESRIRSRMGRYFGGLVYDPDRFKLVRSIKKSISSLSWRNDHRRIRSIIRAVKGRGTGAIVITLEEELGTGRSSPIYVLDQMFETPSIPSEEDLISAFVNHERVHVDQVGDGICLRNARCIDSKNFTVYHEVDLKIPGRPPVKTVQIAQEVQAYTEELRQVLSGNLEVTPLYIRTAVKNFRLFYRLLEKIAASGVAPDDRFAQELADEVSDVAKILHFRFPASVAEKP